MFGTLFRSPAVRPCPAGLSSLETEPELAFRCAERPPRRLHAQPKLGIIPSVQIGYPPWRILTKTKTPIREDHESYVHADALEQLLQRANRFQLLKPAEETERAKRIGRGDPLAKHRLINSNLLLVVPIARRYQGHGLTLNDLVQEGMLGLIRAAEKFDWRKGFRFSTYATLWIRQSIQRGLDNTSRSIRLPAHVATKARKVGRIRNELAVKLER